MPDFAARRAMMVDTQVRPSDVTKYPIIQAMLDIPRERFLPAELAEVAYVGENLIPAPGRVMLEPRTLAKMLDMLALRGTELVLDVAPGTGYSSALLALLGEVVVALEPDEALADEAESMLDAVGASNVLVERQPLDNGAPRHGPYDVMIIQGGIEQLPQALVDQLKEGGHVAALFMEGALGVVRLGVKHGGSMRWRDLFNAAAPVLAGFERARAFVL